MTHNDNSLHVLYLYLMGTTMLLYSVDQTLYALASMGHQVLPVLYIYASHICFPFSNLGSTMIFIHKVRDHKRQAKFDLEIYHFSILE